jgi:hypothetical protein
MRPSTLQRRQAAQRAASFAGAAMVLGQARDVVVERVLAIAASSPAWRQPPPTTLRQRRARSISARSPSSIEPTGAPRPFEKHTDTLSKPRATSRAGTPRRRGVEQARAVEVEAQPVPVRERARLRDVVGGSTRPFQVFSSASRRVRAKCASPAA